MKLGGTCLAKGIKCDFCEKVGHFKEKCRAYKQSQKKEKAASKDKKSIVGLLKEWGGMII